MILSLMFVSVREIFVLILMNLPFVYICGILNFPTSFAIFVMSDVYLLCLSRQVRCQAFEADVLPSLVLLWPDSQLFHCLVYFYVLGSNLILFHQPSGRCS